MNAESAVGQIDSYSLEALSDAVQPWDSQFNQLSPGPFHARTEYVSLGSLTFYSQHWNQRIHFTGCTPPGYLMIGCPLKIESEIIWCSERLNQQRLALEFLSGEIQFSTAGTSDHLVLLIKHELLRQYVDREIYEDLLNNTHVIGCSNRFRVMYTDRLIRCIQKYLRNPSDLLNAQEQQSIEFDIMTTLAEELSTSNTSPISTSRSKRAKAIGRALEYAGSQQRVTAIPDIARAAGVSQRTLEYAFRERYGLSPVGFFKLLRMNRCRETLVDTQPDSTLVHDVASRWGFRHLGRFAVEYQQMFGEHPSASLFRSRKQSDKSLLDLMH